MLKLRMISRAADRLLSGFTPASEAVARYHRAHAETASMLSRHFGAPLFEAARGRVVLDYGCGDGPDAIALAKCGAARVIGLDPHEGQLARARARAAAAGVQGRCVFATEAPGPADLVVSSDTFEHVYDLAAALRHINALLNPGGTVWAAFGPPWYHPKGGHIFSVFPWAHLILSEAALCRWRSRSNSFVVPCFLDAGLNRMSVGRFLRIVADSPFQFDAFDLIPIQRVRRLGLERWRLTRELATSVIRCRLSRRSPFMG